MSILGETINLLSANCQGLQSNEKRYNVYFRTQDYDILCLQDTHWNQKHSTQIRKLWGNKCIIHGNKTNAQGVAILFGDKFEYSIHDIHKDIETK